VIDPNDRTGGASAWIKFEQGDRDMNAIVNPNTIKIEKIKNGLIVEYEEAVPKNGADPEIVKAQIEKDLEAIRQAPVLRDMSLRPKESIYRWKTTRLYCRNVEELSKALPEIVMALIIKESEDANMNDIQLLSGSNVSPSVGFVIPDSMTFTTCGTEKIRFTTDSGGV
jgi:hypothetical protein